MKGIGNDSERSNALLAMIVQSDHRSGRTCIRECVVTDYLSPRRTRGQTV